MKTNPIFGLRGRAWVGPTTQLTLNSRGEKTQTESIWFGLDWASITIFTDPNRIELNPFDSNVKQVKIKLIGD